MRFSIPIFQNKIKPKFSKSRFVLDVNKKSTIVVIITRKAFAFDSERGIYAKYTHVHPHNNHCPKTRAEIITTREHKMGRNRQRNDRKLNISFAPQYSPYLYSDRCSKATKSSRITVNFSTTRMNESRWESADLRTKLCQQGHKKRFQVQTKTHPAEKGSLHL